jgi:hypothetical protein
MPNGTGSVTVVELNFTLTHRVEVYIPENGHLLEIEVHRCVLPQGVVFFAM